MAFITPVASNRFDVKRRGKKKEDKNLARVALRNSKCLHVGINQRRSEKGKKKKDGKKYFYLHDVSKKGDKEKKKEKKRNGRTRWSRILLANL